MRQSPLLPPVFVLNIYYSGMGIARSLDGKGVRVYGLSSETDAPGVKSRFFHSIYSVPNGRDEPESLCRKLIELRNQHEQSPVLFPTRDFDVLFLHRYRRELGGLYRLPDDGAAALLDKVELANIAQRERVSAPATAACRTVAEVRVASQELRFPLVLKPRFAYQWRRGEAWQMVGSRKAILARNVDELLREYHRVAAVDPEVLVQEFISGEETDIVVCCCNVGRDGQLLSYFTARKLRQNPPLFGTGCAVETADIPEIVPLAARLLQGCGYRGLAEVEFKYNKETDKYYLIEINPRHWDQHQLGTLVGVNLTWMAYTDMIGKDAPPQRPIYRGRKCRWIAESETLVLMARKIVSRTNWQAEPRLRSTTLAAYAAALRTTIVETLFLLKGRKMFATFHRRDPLPGLALCLRGARDMYHVLRTRRA